MSVQEQTNHVEGENRGQVALFALSTCGWCRKTKQLLNELGVGYSYVDVDQLQGADREEALQQLRIFNPDISFPTIVIDGEHCIVGFKEDEVREALSDGRRD
ncbi:MAG: glutaredoxin family protein [Dehalococcoidia bacterium]